MNILEYYTARVTSHRYLEGAVLIQFHTLSVKQQFSGVIAQGWAR